MKKAVHLALVLLVLSIFFSGCSKNEKSIAGFADAQNARIGVMTGSTGEAVAVKRFPKAQVKSFDDIMDAVAAIKSGQLDAIITLFPAALQVSKKNPELRILPEPLDFEDTAIAVKKGNDQLLATVDRIVAALKADGTLADMEKRWLKPDLSPYQERAIVLPRQGNALKIGVSATREPFSFVDDHGRVSGFDGELARIIAAKLERPVEFSNMKFMALIPALQSGKVDLIISGMTATNERKKTVNFTQPYFANKQVMLVRKPAAAFHPKSELNSINSLKGKRICVLAGSAGDVAARKAFPGSEFQTFTASADAALAIKTNKADAFVYDKSVLLNLVEKNPELMILDQAVDKLEVAAAVRKDNTALLASMNKALQGLKQEGELQRLRTKWVDTRYAVTPQLPPAKAVHTNGVLRMGTCANLEPFSFQSNGIITGLDRELSQLIGERLNKEIEIVDMNFEALIPALQSGKIDFALSNFNVTEERKKLVSFSVPYITNDISVLVRKTGASATTAVPSFLSGLVTSFQSNIIMERRYLLILDGLKTTVIISVFATLFGTLLGALICFMRMAKSRLLSAPARLYIAILRGTPVLVLLMLIFYVVFASVNINPVIVAVIAFGMNFGAYTAEIFRTGIEGVEKGQTEAGISLGFTRTSTFFQIVLPQMVRRILPVYKGEFISLVKMTSIVGYIAVQDLTKASDIIRSRTFDAFFPLVMVAILYFLISWTLMQSLEYLERITDPKYKKRKAGRA
ncbi:ABC transporter permease subunit [Trichlorobacter lovleyi]|uniref:ABC transporter permease subunit n=1 Tax=Trichlorobacter lovleyi TaxID=313985 RepID=UPI00224025A3|nr:ABC transporter permease subunit [Trichlorobacter lovleyi]QOX79099.1 ABC transporter permease subunit [Trichlorobacter lovleyi]